MFETSQHIQGRRLTADNESNSLRALLFKDQFKADVICPHLFMARPNRDTEPKHTTSKLNNDKITTDGCDSPNHSSSCQPSSIKSEPTETRQLNVESECTSTRSSYKMKRKSFGSESEKRRGERFQREREMSTAMWKTSRDRYKADEGGDYNSDQSEKDEAEDNNSLSGSSAHVCDFSCPLIAQGECPNASNSKGKKGRKGRQRSSFGSSNQLSSLLASDHRDFLMGSMATPCLDPLISTSITDLTGVIEADYGHQWRYNVRRRALGLARRRPALIPTSEDLLPHCKFSCQAQQESGPTPCHHRRVKQGRILQDQQLNFHGHHHEENESVKCYSDPTTTENPLTSQTTCHRQYDILSLEDTDTGHQLYATRQKNQKLATTTSCAITAEDTRKPSGLISHVSPKTGGVKGKCSDSLSLTSSDDSDVDTKPAEKSPTVRSHRLGSFLSAGSKSSDLPSNERHDQLVEIGQCMVKVTRCFQHLRFPSTLEPHSKIYVSWLFLVTLAFMYNAVVIPLRGVFPYQTSDNLRYWMTADYFCDLVYLLDILVFKSRLRFINNGIDECARTETRKKYMEKWRFKCSGQPLAEIA
ncbi:cyclic nucleotide-gated cation channel beta-1 [Plakobranchus ocellatus]|uniref:Cyclic nucleotide-gated cation channel beta-1 n=1 Tax=Plakobranchus ocellatus TaxID=259542 RepID=A0AAV4DP48_9GAST|nr:cyclic nucleotide-gated cation channel beta-1 [Plakobranchus ocellatus]